MLAVLALQQSDRRAALGRGDPAVQLDSASGRARGESAGHDSPPGDASAPDAPIPNPLGPRTWPVAAPRSAHAGGADTEDEDVPDLIEDTVVAAMLVTAAVKMFAGVLNSIQGAHSLVDAAVLLSRAFFFTDKRAWRGKEFVQWTRKDFNLVSSMPLASDPVEDLLAWSKVAFDVYFVSEGDGEIKDKDESPAPAGGITYTRDDPTTRPRFQVALQQALSLSTSADPPALNPEHLWEVRRQDSVSGRLDQPFAIYLYGSSTSHEPPAKCGERTLVVAIPGTSSLGDWVTTLSDRDVDDNTLATLGHGMGDTLPALRDRNDLRVHFEYQTLAREVFDNIIRELAKVAGGDGASFLAALDRVMIVGHSKGAGVGQILAAMLLVFRASVKSAALHVSLRAYAPPKVATPLAQAFIHSQQREGDSLVGVVNKSDIVPRLSRHSLAQLIQGAMTPYPRLGTAPNDVRLIAEREDCGHVLEEAEPKFDERPNGTFRSGVMNDASQVPTLDVMCDVAFIHPDGRHLVALRDPHQFLSRVIYTDRIIHDHRMSSHVLSLQALRGGGGGSLETIEAYRVRAGGAAAVGLLRRICCCCCSSSSDSTNTAVAPAGTSR